MIVRPVKVSDLPALMALVQQAGPGFTTLPANEDRLSHRVRWAQRAFAEQVERADADYLFVLEDDDMRVVGVSAVLFFVVFFVFLIRLYRRATKETAFVRTGFGGEKVVMNGGALVFPVFHEAMPVNMNTLVLPVVRRDAEALITGKDGKIVWDRRPYAFLNSPEAPDTVNPSLWRQARLNAVHGLFEVVPDKIWQLRGYDLSVMTIIRGKTGWIVVDPLLSEEAAAASWKC